MAASDVTGDGQADIITAAGPGGGPHLKIFDAASSVFPPEEVRSIFVAPDNFAGGIFVASSTNLESGAPLRLADGFALTGEVDSLTLAEVQPVFDAALLRLESAGLSPEAAETFSTLTIEVADLAGNRLGQALPGRIVLDVTAAGVGWFIDPTPLTDEEFAGVNQMASAPEAAERIDLLTVVLHELAHQLGAADLSVADFPDHLLAETLTPGSRRLPSLEDLDHLFANPDLQEPVFS